MTILIENEYLNMFEDYYSKEKPNYNSFISYVFDLVSDLVDENVEDDRYKSFAYNNEITMIYPILQKFIKEKYFSDENATTTDYTRTSKLTIEDEKIYKEEFNKILDALIYKRNKELRDDFEKMTNGFIAEKIDIFLNSHVNGKMSKEEEFQRENLYHIEYFALRKIFEDIFNDRINKRD